MTLQQRLEENLLMAIKGQDPLTRDVLRGVKSAIRNHEIEIGAQNLPDEEIEKVIAREVKRRRESIESYNQANKPDLAAVEEQELAILQQYLPEQLSEEQIEKTVDQTIAELGDSATTGAVMGKLSAALRGKADMGFVVKLVNQKLAR